MCQFCSTKRKVIAHMEKKLQQVADLIAAQINYTAKAVLTTDEAARYMNVSKSALYKLMMRREIPFSKPNGKLCFFSRQELENWLMHNRVATADELQERAQTFCSRTRLKKGGAAR